MEDSTPGLREIAYLMVVQRGDQDRYRFLQTTFQDKPVEVMWDRRQGERRRATTSANLDRRRSDRRSDPPSSWGSLGFLVARRSA